jgi:hypothetical protein
MPKQIRRRVVVMGMALGLTLAGSAALAQRGANHPRLVKAIEDMKEAKAYLQNAPKTFGGHKAKAINALDAAIRELEAALDFAR